MSIAIAQNEGYIAVYERVDMVIEIAEVRDRTPELVEVLTRVWERSVRASHDFLSEHALKEIAQEVPGAIVSVALLAVACEGQVPVAFAGAQDGKLEMLFVDAQARGRGVGRELLTYAIANWDVHRVDVNEQNSGASDFYRKNGFAAVARSTSDDAGRPFPLLHMERTEGVRAQATWSAWFNAAASEFDADHARAGGAVHRFNYDATLSKNDQEELLRGLLGSFGKDSTVSPGIRVDFGYHVFLGERCFFNYNATFLDGAPITFGDDVWVGPGCTFATPLHPLLGRERALRVAEDGSCLALERCLPIVVGSKVWFASNVTVNPGVSIGEGSVIGSGSVVTKDIPPYSLAFGNPCRVAREITEKDSVGDVLAEVGLT